MFKSVEMEILAYLGGDGDLPPAAAGWASLPVSGLFMPS